MPEKSSIELVVQRAVSEVLDGHLARIQSELVARVLQEIEPHLGALVGGSAGDGNPANLLKVISTVQTGTTQREILRALLDGAAGYTSRVALFVVKAGNATGWQARGFSKSDDIKDFKLDLGSGLAARALGSRTPSAGPTDQIDSRFVSRFQPPSAGKAIVLPLVLKEKVAALVYADAGTLATGKMDAAAMELLVVTTSAWLEVVSLRKQSAKEGNTEAPNLDKVLPRRPRHLRRRIHLPPTFPRIFRHLHPTRPLPSHSKPHPQWPPKLNRFLAGTHSEPPLRLQWLRRLQLLPGRKTRKFTVKRNALPGSWSTKSSSTIRPKSPKAAKTGTFKPPERRY